jgi:hypothetical protein
MSTLMDQARNAMPRFAEAAVERARLTLVPRPLTGRSSRAARVPFVALVSLLLVGGVAGLLFFNTSMQQASFRATAMEQKAQVLVAQRQALQMQLDTLRDPQRVALRAKAMGMVPPASPAFIRLGDGKVLGTPMPAVADSRLRITPLPTKKPDNLVQTPIIVTPAVKPAGNPAGDPADARAADGAARAGGATANGTKKTRTIQDEARGSRR